MNGPSAVENPTATNRLATSEIEARLRHREHMKRAGAAVLLAIGLPALCLGPFIVACIYWLLVALWGFYVPWLWMLLGTFAVLVPLLFWTEWRTRGSFYTTSVLATYGNRSDLPPPVTGFSDVDGLIRFVRHPRDPYVGLIELFLWGPRQILEAITTIHDSGCVAAADRNCAAEILRMLVLTDHADVKALASGRQSEVGMAIAYLVYYDWIGISADRTKVWIETASRDVFRR